MTDLHDADEGFVRDLEWQLRTEVRRNQRFGSIKKPSRLPGVARTVVLILLCAATGYAAAVTVERFENAKKKELMKVRAETALDLLRARQEVISEVIDDMTGKVNRGLVNATQLADVAFQSELVALEINRARLDLEEVELTGRSPEYALYAPVVGGRDLVSERLKIDQLASVARRRFVETQLEGIRELVREGLADAVQEGEMQMQLSRVEAETEEIVRRLELRHGYLQGDLTARQVSLEEKLTLAGERLETAKQNVALVTQNHERMVAMSADGLVSAIQMKEVELQLAQARAEERLARAELEYLEEAVRHR